MPTINALSMINYKYALSLFLLFLSIGSLQGQKTTIEKSQFNAQVGWLGIWGNGEFRLSDEISLRTELGVAVGYYAGGVTGSVSRYTVWTPNMIIEPRWYFDLAKRAENNKKTQKNTASYVSLKLSYISGNAIYSTNNLLSAVETIKVVPFLGIRRHIGTKINFELGLGFGLTHEPNRINPTFFEMDAILRLGYSF